MWLMSAYRVPKKMEVNRQYVLYLSFKRKRATRTYRCFHFSFGRWPFYLWPASRPSRRDVNLAVGTFRKQIKDSCLKQSQSKTRQHEEQINELHIDTMATVFRKNVVFIDIGVAGHP